MRKFVERTELFTDADGINVERVRSLINCATTRVIYGIQCLCNKIYIGKTYIASASVSISEILGKRNPKVP